MPYSALVALVFIALLQPACSSSGGGAADELQGQADECGERCAGMTQIPAGLFTMGSPSDEGRPREHPWHIVNFEKPFWIDTNEVTNADYAEFLRAHGNNCPWNGKDYPCYDCGTTDELIEDRRILCEDDWPLKTDCQRAPGGTSSGSCEDHPVTLVFWSGARAYCEWKGKRLPSEAEWERAANGPGGNGSDWRRFPWGDLCPTPFNLPGILERCGEAPWVPSTARANCEESFCNDGYIWTAPVGSFPTGASPEGVMDMSGNVMEWVEDCFHENFAPTDTIKAPADGSAWLTNCAENDPLRKVATGGSHVDDGANLRMAFRGGDPLDAPEADPDVGFRCAWTPE